MNLPEGFQVYFTPDPNVVVLRGRGQHLILTTRTGEVKDFMVEDAAKVAMACTAYEKLNEAIYVRLRHYWGDNSHGTAVGYVDVLHSAGASPEYVQLFSLRRNDGERAGPRRDGDGTRGEDRRRPLRAERARVLRGHPHPQQGKPGRLSVQYRSGARERASGLLEGSKGDFPRHFRVPERSIFTGNRKSSP